MIANLGEKIRELRLASGLSVRKLADKAKISAPFLSDIELGRRSPSANVMERIEAGVRAKKGTLCQYDLRALKRKIDEDPELGFALQALAHEIQSRRVPTSKVIELLRGLEKKRR